MLRTQNMKLNRVWSNSEDGNEDAAHETRSRISRRHSYNEDFYDSITDLSKRSPYSEGYHKPIYNEYYIDESPKTPPYYNRKRRSSEGFYNYRRDYMNTGLQNCKCYNNGFCNNETDRYNDIYPSSGKKNINRHRRDSSNRITDSRRNSKNSQVRSIRSGYSKSSQSGDVQEKRDSIILQDLIKGLANLSDNTSDNEDTLHTPESTNDTLNDNDKDDDIDENKEEESNKGVKKKRKRDLIYKTCILGLKAGLMFLGHLLLTFLKVFPII
jgi:hypothetical protein